MREKTRFWIRVDKDAEGNVVDRIPFPTTHVPPGERECTYDEAVALEKERENRPTRGHQPLTTTKAMEEKKRMLDAETAKAKANMPSGDPFAEVDERTPPAVTVEDRDALQRDKAAANESDMLGLNGGTLATNPPRLIQAGMDGTTIVTPEQLTAMAAAYGMKVVPDPPADIEATDPGLQQLRQAEASEPVPRPKRRASFGTRARFPQKADLIRYAKKYYPDAPLRKEYTRADLEGILKDWQDAEWQERKAVEGGS